MPSVPATYRKGVAPPFSPTEAERKRAKRLALMGLSCEECARRMGMGLSTFRKHFREEWQESVETRNGNVVETLYTAAESAIQDVPDRLSDGTVVGTKRVIQQPGVTAAIYLSKARLGWRDRAELDINHRFARHLDPDDEDL